MKCYDDVVSTSFKEYDISLNKKYSVDIPVKTGYKFDGYYDNLNKKIIDSEGNSKNKCDWYPSNEKIVYAHWNINQYNIKFQGDNVDSETQTYNYGYTFDLPRLDDFDRFQFVGWEIENVVYNIDSNFKYTMPAYDVVANAVWNDKIVHITNRSEFIAMVKSNSNDGYYVLDNDITLSSWSPLSGCIGYFDGNGHKITINTSKNAVSGKCYYGIFGNLTNSTVINLRIFAGISITTSGSDNNDRFFVGGLCGRSNNSTIKNVSVSGNIKTSQSTSDSGTTIAGGIVGYSNNSEIVDCSNEAYINITKCSSGAGGICGYAEEKTKFTNCVNNGEIYTTGYGGVLGIGQGVSSAGGICAFSYGSIGYYNCYNYGSITAEWGRTSSDDICAYPNCDWMV